MTKKQPHNLNLKNSVMGKIGDQKPVSKSWYQLINWGRILLVTILAVIAGSLLGFYLKELVENLEVAGDFNFRIIALANSFFELVIVTFAISGILYFLYRQTDWLFVEHRLKIFFGIWLIILTISIIFVAISISNPNVNDFVEDTKSQSNNLPFRKKRIENILGRQKREGLIVGRITDIKMEDNKIFIVAIENPAETVEIKISLEMRKKLRVADFVEVKTDKENPEIIKEIRRRPLRPRSP